MSYIWSGGSEVENTSAGASSISGSMVGYLIAADTYETETPFARIFRAYGTDVKTTDFVIESAGTGYFNNGTHTNLYVGPKGSASVSSSYLTGGGVGGFYDTVSGTVNVGTLLLYKKITADNITVYSGGLLTVSSATLNNVTVSGNTNKWYGETAMARMNVSGKGNIIGGSAVNACRIMVYSGGVVSNFVAHTSTHLYAYANALISGCEIHCANLEVRAGTVRDTTVDSGGILKFTRAASGQTFDVTIGSNGSAAITSGGTMTRTTAVGYDGGAATIMVSSGAAVSTTIGSSGAMTVSKLAWYTPAVTSTTLTDRGSLELYGVASDTVANNWGRMNVRSGGVASGVTLDDGGKTYLYANASADAVTANANGYFYLYSGAAATNVVENGGFAWGQAGTELTFVSNAFSDVSIHSHATIHEVTTATNLQVAGSDGTIVSAIAFGGIINNIELASGGLLLVNSGYISGATVHSGGSIYIQLNNDKTFLSGAVVESGASMTMKGGSVQNVTVSGGVVSDDADNTITDTAHLDVYGGTLDSLTVIGISGCYGRSNVQTDTNKRICAVISGGIVNSVTMENAGFVTVSGATVSNVTLHKDTDFKAWCYVKNVSSSMNTRLYIYSGGTAVNVSVLYGAQCEAFVASGGVLSNIALDRIGYFGAYSGALIKDGILSGKGADMQGRGGMISGLTLISSGAMFVSNGGVKGNNVISGGYLRVGSKGAVAVADSTFISGGYGEKIVSAGKEKYTSGVATAFVSSGGKLTNSLIGDGAHVIVRSNGIASNTALLGINSYDANTQDQMMMARIHVSGGALWQGGDVLKHVQAIVYSGGSTEGITLGSGAHVYVSANATVTNLVADGTLDFGLRGGTAENTLVKKGSMTISNGGVASGTTLRGGVLRLINATAVASDTVVSNGGVISCHSGGGTFENTTVSKGGYLYGVFGTYNGVTVSSGGSMRIYASGGAVVTGLTAEAGANLILDFSRVSGGSLNIDSLVGVNAPVTVVNYTTDKSYTLAETGNENLEISINYQGFYNEFGAGETYLSPIYGGRAFTLDAEGKTLSIATHSMSGTILTTEAADLATSGAFLTGYVNSDDKALMWADVQFGSAVTFATSAANIAGDAWIDLDRTQAAAGGTIYGAEGDCMSDATIRYLIHGAGSVGNFAGGATSGGVVGGVELVGFNNTYGQTYLGGMGTVQGLVSARVSSGNTLAKDFYAGALANYAKTGEVTSVGGIDTTIALHMSAGTAKETKFYAKGNIYGASQVKAGVVTTAATVHEVGDVVLTISNGETTKGNQMCIFAAGYATGHDAEKALPVYTVESVTATIAGGTWLTGEAGACGGRGVFGGAFAGDNTTDATAGVWAKVGDVNLTISGGTLGNVYGGGWAQKGALSEVGNVNLTIKGGTISNVFGGGSHSTSGGTTAAGNVTITVSAGTISGNIYARGQVAGDTTGSATVIFTGAKNFECGVWGYSYVPEPGQQGVGTGATLYFTGYAGTFSGEIGGFDGTTLDGNTTMTLGTAAGGVSNAAWKFDTTERYTALAKSAFLDWSAADFTEDTIAVNLATGSATEWDLVKASGATAETFNKFDVQVDGTSILTETLDLDQAIVGGAYAGWGFTLEEDTLKFKHLA